MSLGHDLVLLPSGQTFLLVALQIFLSFEEFSSYETSSVANLTSDAGLSYFVLVERRL